MRYNQITIEIRDESKEAVEFIAELAKDIAERGHQSAIVCYSPLQKKTTVEKMCEYLELMDQKTANNILVNTLLVDIEDTLTPPIADLIMESLGIEEFSVVFAYSPDNAESVYRDHMVLIGDRYEVAEECDKLLKLHNSYRYRTKITKMGDLSVEDSIKTMVATNVSFMLPFVIGLGIQYGKEYPHAKHITERFYETRHS